MFRSVKPTNPWPQRWCRFQGGGGEHPPPSPAGLVHAHQPRGLLSRARAAGLSIRGNQRRTHTKKACRKLGTPRRERGSMRSDTRRGTPRPAHAITLARSEQGAYRARRNSHETGIYPSIHPRARRMTAPRLGPAGMRRRAQTLIHFQSRPAN